jgi:kumamolisin
MYSTPGTADRVALPGSERQAVQNARDEGAVHPEEEAEVSVHLRSRMSDADFEKLVNENATLPVAERKYLSREEMAEMRGATQEDADNITQFANRYHLTVVRTDLPGRTMTLRGKLGDLETAFGVKLHNFSSEGIQFRARTGAITLPGDIAPCVQGVFGLDTRPVAKPR